MHIETILLDAGGVLVFPDWGRVCDTLARHGVDVAPEALAEAEAHAKRALDTAERVRSTDDESRGWLYFNRILTRCKIEPCRATEAALAELHAYHTRANLWQTVGADVRPALDRLTAIGLRLAVVSNANGTVQQLLDRLGLTRYFEAIVDSCDEGVEKPDPQIFQIALERSGARRESTLHVGDLYHVDVVGARAAGLSAVLLDAADLYPEVDCPRVSSLTALVTRLVAGELGSVGHA